MSHVAVLRAILLYSCEIVACDVVAMEKEQALEFEKLLKHLEKSKTVRTADLRSKKVRQFMRENVHFECDFGMSC